MVLANGNTLKRWKTRLQSRFNYVITDEGHKTRARGTMLDASLNLHAPMTWMLTASPIVNGCKVSYTSKSSKNKTNTPHRILNNICAACGLLSRIK
jgi:hypothetical protein